MSVDEDADTLRIPTTALGRAAFRELQGMLGSAELAAQVLADIEEAELDPVLQLAQLTSATNMSVLQAHEWLARYQLYTVLTCSKCSIRINPLETSYEVQLETRVVVCVPCLRGKQ